MPRKKSSTESIVAWWLNDGDEHCPHCGQMYAYELEIRCFECDGPTCPHCKVVHAEGYAVCPDCTSFGPVAREIVNG